MSRDERQKIVTDEYRENYDKIFNQKGGNKEKKLITRYKRNEKLSVEELKELLDYYKQRLTGNPLDMEANMEVENIEWNIDLIINGLWNKEH